MNKILITGGAGFIGYFVSKRLSENNENQITIIDNFARGRFDNDFKSLLKKDNVHFIRADLTNPATFLRLDNNFDYIYHFAAVIGVKNVVENPDKVLYVNALSTLNVFEFSINMKNLKKILFSSTSEIYSGSLKHHNIEIPTKENVILTIDDIKSERTTYALSKMFGESICYNYGKKYDIPFRIVRYHNIYGPRMGFAHVIPEMFIKIKNNEIIDVPSPNHSRAFCYIDDAVEMTIKACENKNTNNEIFHIGNSEEEIRIKELAKKISNIMNKEITIKELPETPGSTKRRCPDISKIISYIDYYPTTSLNEGISKTFYWYENKLDEIYE